MGFETQEEAERWAEGVELRADARREERMLKTETDERNSLPANPIIGLRKPWAWVQPKDRAELVQRLLEAREYDVPPRERENLCSMAYEALRDEDA